MAWSGKGDKSRTKSVLKHFFMMMLKHLISYDVECVCVAIKRQIKSFFNMFHSLMFHAISWVKYPPFVKRINVYEHFYDFAENNKKFISQLHSRDGQLFPIPTAILMMHSLPKFANLCRFNSRHDNISVQDIKQKHCKSSL